MERAINYEIERQIEALERGDKVVQETRLYDAQKDETRPMRGKEEANDYRYFPDPDLLPLEVTEEMVETVRSELPELPDAKRDRFVEEYGLSLYDSAILTETIELAHYYEDVVKSAVASPKLAANWIIGELSAAMHKAAIEINDCPLQPQRLGELLTRIEDRTISGKIAKQIFETMWSQGQTADEIIETRGLKQITDVHAIESMVEQVIANSPQQVEQYRSGKQKVFGYFVGQVMKLSKGKANPAQVNQLLRSKLQG